MGFLLTESYVMSGTLLVRLSNSWGGGINSNEMKEKKTCEFFWLGFIAPWGLWYYWIKLYEAENFFANTEELCLYWL
jgi:hypothetical protein